MTGSTDLAFISAADLASMIAQRQVSPVEVIEAALTRSTRRSRS